MAGIDRFTKDEFELALPVHKKTGDALWYPIGLVEEEFVYAVPVAKTNKRIVIRSSVDHTERAAMCGHDSIRLWLEYQYKGEWHPLKKLDRWTTRVPGWDRRLKDKIRDGETCCLIWMSLVRLTHLVILWKKRTIKLLMAWLV